MKTTILALSGLAGLSSAAICNNNCGRQVWGTALARPPVPTSYAQRSAVCSDFLTTYTTVTPPAATVTDGPIFARKVDVREAAPAPLITAAPVVARNVHVRDTPVLVSHKPAWATACSADIDYYNACQCFGITPTIITVTAPTPTVHLPGPSCTQGVEYALYNFHDGDGHAEQLHAANDGDGDISRLSYDNLLGGVPPAQTGVVSGIGADSSKNQDPSQPLQFSGFSGPEGSRSDDNVVVYRGYIVPASAGAYTFEISDQDDIAAIWTGDEAVSNIDISQAHLASSWGEYHRTTAHTFVVTPSQVGETVPFRILFANVQVGAVFVAKVTDPTGNVILGLDSQKNHQIISSCTPGGDTPEWPAWESEH